MEASELEPPRRHATRLSLREYIGLVTIGMLLVGLVMNSYRLRRQSQELALLRLETGYLAQTDPGTIAAARAPSDQPLTYRIRVRVPDEAAGFRVAYSSIWPKSQSGPQWYGAVPVPVGESIVTVRIQEDPRDGRWKIATLVGSTEGNRRMATTLPPEQVQVFRGSYDALSTGVGRETVAMDSSRSLRILDERWLVGEESLLLYGNRPPDSDQIGIYAELQPDDGPL